MKLELKHLSPYLPYGLNMAFIVREKIIKVGTLNNISINNSDTHPIRYSIDTLNELEHEWMFKPILRPLSDLKQHECYTSLSDNLRFNIDILGFPNYLDLKVNDYNILLENHFDIYGLIEQNLAININTL